MIHVNAVHSQADAHRHDLAVSASSRHTTRRPLDVVSATQRSAAGFPVTGGRAVRRTVAPRLGAWMIHFGTRLGGRSIQTS